MSDDRIVRDLRDVCRAVAESLFYRRIIFDPPHGWPRFHLFGRKAKR